MRGFPWLPCFNHSSNPSLKQLQTDLLCFLVSTLLWWLLLNKSRELEPFKSLWSPKYCLLGNCCCNITADFAVLMRLPCDLFASLGINKLPVTFYLGFSKLTLTLLLGTSDGTSLGPGHPCQARSHMALSGQQKKSLQGKEEKKPYPSFTAVPRILWRTLSFLLGGYGSLY